MDASVCASNILYVIILNFVNWDLENRGWFFKFAAIQLEEQKKQILQKKSKRL